MHQKIRLNAWLIILTMPCIVQAYPNNEPALTISLNNSTHGAHRGLIKDTQTTLANLPQAIASMLPTVSNIQKLLLSASLIGLGYQSCKYGLSNYKTASDLYSKSNESEKDKQRYSQSKLLALTGTSFIMMGACLLWYAQRIATIAYGK